MSVTMLSKWNKLRLNCSLLHFMDLNCHHVQRGAPSNLTRGSFLFLFRLILFFFSLQHSEQLWKTHYAIHVCRWITDCRLHDLLTCVTSVSVRFRSKERGARVKDQARTCSSKTFFGFSFHFSRGQNQKSRSSVFLCSETKRKRLLRRLPTSQRTPL